MKEGQEKDFYYITADNFHGRQEQPATSEVFRKKGIWKVLISILTALTSG